MTVAELLKKAQVRLPVHHPRGKAQRQITPRNTDSYDPMRLPSKIGNYKLPTFVLLMMEHARLTEAIHRYTENANLAKGSGYHGASQNWAGLAWLAGQKAQQVWKEARKESRHER